MSWQVIELQSLLECVLDLKPWSHNAGFKVLQLCCLRTIFIIDSPE